MRYVLVRFSTSSFDNFGSKRGTDRGALSLCSLLYDRDAVALPSSPVRTDKMLKINFTISRGYVDRCGEEVTDGVGSQYLLVQMAARDVRHD